MNLKDIILTANSNLMRNKLRTTLTILAIFIGAFTLTLTNGLGSGISNYVNSQVANLGQQDAILITAKTDTASQSSGPTKYTPGQGGTTSVGVATKVVALTSADVTKLQADSDLTNVQPIVGVNPDYIQGANGEKYDFSTALIGSRTTLDLAAGGQIATSGSASQIIIPAEYVSPMGYSSNQAAINQPVTIAITDATGAQHTVTATIVGVQQVGLVGASNVVLSNSLKQSLYGLQSTGLPAAAKDKYVGVDATITGNVTSSRITDVKNNLATMGYSGTTVSDELGTFEDIVNAITWVLDAFAIIALLAASFGIVNTLLMSVQERTKEIGLMKAMGMRSSRIFTLFSLEAVLIGFWGSFIGVVIAMLAGSVANHAASKSLLKDLPGFNLLAFPPLTLLGIIVLIMAIAFIAGTLPARRAAKQNPIDALRYE